jgi:hypothetical protein
LAVAVIEWHPGKLILLWAWCVALALLGLFGVRAMPSGSRVGILVGFTLLVFAVTVPVALSVITWIWLGGREGKEG